MYIYLSKKIAIPNNTKINCIAWNKEDGYIAVGGDGGLLKVLKLDSGSDNDVSNSGLKSKGLTAASNLSMNQTLEGHSESIRVITWNQKHQKLTTSDQNGIIIVWMLYKGTWYEEMINNRKKSIVVGMSWSSDGSKICIIYEDGAVIVGAVDGNRIWGKELKAVPLSKVQWSPDGKLLLFGLRNGQVHLYDNLGNFVMQIEVLCSKILNSSIEISIVGMDWYNGKYGHIYALCPTLAICYENGYMQLMCNESDPDPVIVETRMIVAYCCWNHNGSLLAVAGKQHRDDNKHSNAVQFYSPFGEHLRTLKLPGYNVSSCSWEDGSLRIALGIDSSVYFANIRPDYKWCYFKNTIVYTSCRLQKAGVCISFWDVLNNQCHVRYVPILLALAAFGEHCVLATRLDTDNPMGQYGLLLCNTLGTPVDGKYTDIEIKWVSMNSTHVVAASKNNYFLWQYRTPKSAVVHLKDSKCQIHHVDYDPTGANLVMKDFKLPVDTPRLGSHDSYDPICCITMSEKYLIIGKESGILKQFSIPQVVIVNTYTLSVRPHKMSMNCNSTRLSVIDMAGVLTVLNITDMPLESNDNEQTRLERKDVWAMCWASDNPQFLAIMEKTRMYVFKGIYPEEPISSAGYICSFQNLEIQAVLLDEVMDMPEKPMKEQLFKLEVKSLRDTRQLLEKVGIKEAAQFIEDNPHPRLWHLLGEAALKNLNLKVAEEAFIRSQNYSGIQLVKRLQEITSDAIRKATVAAYFKNFDEAEKLYTEEDRRDLALNLRKTLGDWFRVIQIMKNGVSAPDQLLDVAYNRTADYFTHTNNWSAAIEYYEMAGNKKMMIESYFHLHDYKSLESIMEQLQDNDPLLKYIAKIFTAEGDYASAIRAYLKIGDLNAAIQVSVHHHQWDQAIYIAKKYHLNQVAQLFVNYSEHLVKENKINRAVEINVQAKYWLTAAKHATQFADRESKKSISEPKKLKRMYVYAARLVEIHKKEPNSEERVNTFIDTNLVENGWKGAEAFHFYMLAHQQLYNRQIHDAVCTLYKLQNYASHLPAREIYSLLAAAAYLDGAYGLCSKMFVKLSSLKELTIDEQAEYEKLSLKIFINQEPLDLDQGQNILHCLNCHSAVYDWETICPHCDMHFVTCVASGRPIIAQDLQRRICNTCHHPVIEMCLGVKKTCPLCHCPYNTFV